MFSQFDHIKYLIQPTNRSGWVRVLTVAGQHVADFMTDADAEAWCEAQAY